MERSWQRWLIRLAVFIVMARVFYAAGLRRYSAFGG